MMLDLPARRPRLSLGALLAIAASSVAVAAPQAIDRPMWASGTQFYQHIVDTIDIEGDVLVTSHTHQSQHRRYVTVFDRDPSSGDWVWTQDLALSSVGVSFSSVRFVDGRIYAGVPNVRTDVYERDATGQFVIVDSVPHQSQGVGWCVYAKDDLLVGLGSSDVEVHERDATTGAFQLVQTLTLGTGTMPIGSSVAFVQDDWLFVSQRSMRGLIFLRRDATTGLYAEHSRWPFPSGDFYLGSHAMEGSRARFFYGSNGGSVVVEFRYDASSDAWTVAHEIRELVPPPNSSSPSLRGFGTSIDLEGDRLAIADESPYVGGSSIFEFDAATDTWNRTRILRSREFPAEYLSDTAIELDQGRVAVATRALDDIQRNVEITIWDLGADADGNFVVDASEIGVPYCDPAVINFSFVPGRLGAYQPGGPNASSFQLIAQHLPANTFGFAISSSGSAYLPTPGGSRGNLCLAPGPTLGRFVDDVESTGDAGWFETTVDLNAIPVATGAPRVLSSGDVWYFQLWYRDGPTSNFTNAVEVTVP